MPQYYFAYRSNLDEEQLKSRCPECKFIGKGLKLTLPVHSNNDLVS